MQYTKYQKVTTLCFHSNRQFILYLIAGAETGASIAAGTGGCPELHREPDPAAAGYAVRVPAPHRAGHGGARAEDIPTPH